jgi:prephenate dehydrogenase
MKKPIIVLGIGELGSVFARAFLKNNHPVYPITRATLVLSSALPEPPLITAPA